MNQPSTSAMQLARIAAAAFEWYGSITPETKDRAEARLNEGERPNRWKVGG